MSVVDDFGRYYANSTLLRAACYPLRLDKVSNADVEKWLAECAGAALVSTYEVGGKRYLQMLDFKQQIRQSQSKFPPPPSECSADAEQPYTKTKSKSESKTETKAGEKKSRGRARRTSMPPDFGISDRVRQWATDRGFGSLDEHLDAFRRKAQARGYQYIDWEAAFMEAIREDWAKLRSGQRGVGPGRGAAAVESFVRRGGNGR